MDTHIAFNNGQKRNELNRRIDEAARELYHSGLNNDRVNIGHGNIMHIVADHRPYLDMQGDHFTTDPIRTARDEYVTMTVIASVNIDAFSQPDELYDFTKMVLEAGADGIQAHFDMNDEAPDYILLAAAYLASEDAGKIFTTCSKSLKCNHHFTF
jgi:hypothetical protein